MRDGVVELAPSFVNWWSRYMLHIYIYIYIPQTRTSQIVREWTICPVVSFRPSNLTFSPLHRKHQNVMGCGGGKPEAGRTYARCNELKMQRIDNGAFTRAQVTRNLIVKLHPDLSLSTSSSDDGIRVVARDYDRCSDAPINCNDASAIFALQTTHALMQVRNRTMDAGWSSLAWISISPRTSESVG